MKTIIDKTSGKVLFVALAQYDLQDNQNSIDLLVTDNFIEPYYNFETKLFYEGSQEQVTPPPPIKEIMIDLLTKQVETLSETEKSDLLQTILNP